MSRPLNELAVVMEVKDDYLFKIVLIGDSGVGKTSIIRRYIEGSFTSTGLTTQGVDFCRKSLQIGSSTVKVPKLDCIVYFWGSYLTTEA